MMREPTATDDVLDSLRAELMMLREALGVAAEPASTLKERTLLAARDARETLGRLVLGDLRATVAATYRLQGDTAAPTGFVSVQDGLPPYDQALRVLAFTEGVDFAGEQFFDIKADDLYPSEDPDSGTAARTEVAQHVTHWRLHSYPASTVADGVCEAPIVMATRLALERAAELYDSKAAEFRARDFHGDYLGAIACRNALQKVIAEMPHVPEVPQAEADPSVLTDEERMDLQSIIKYQPGFTADVTVHEQFETALIDCKGDLRRAADRIAGMEGQNHG
ncbi:hypothetical protein BSFA1_80240 (plasmid) [Burkholderia sp. SFA1]|nr:hypothetical protein BSFA1_80240 [Burkholderia sp. SFA1]